MVQYINIHWKCDRAKSGALGWMLLAKNLSSDPVLILPSHRHEVGYIFYEGQEFGARETKTHHHFSADC